MHSLYEEQLTGEQLATSHHMEVAEESFGEALSFLPRPPGSLSVPTSIWNDPQDQGDGRRSVIGS
jgi:hypothetical protein